VQAVFELQYFQKNPAAFYQLIKELMPGSYNPTPTHHFIKLLHDKGLLLRCYTQNIDSLETAAGLPADKVVAAHGTFDTASCIACNVSVPMAHVGLGCCLQVAV
jgi:NAD-dependent SIR2 family protein deacetylase